MKRHEIIILSAEDVKQLIQKEYPNHTIGSCGLDSVTLEVKEGFEPIQPTGEEEDEPTELDWFVGKVCSFSDDSIKNSKGYFINMDGYILLEIYGGEPSPFTEKEYQWRYFYHPAMEKLGLDYWEKKIDEVRG